jgi:hypothetical protein
MAVAIVSWNADQFLSSMADKVARGMNLAVAALAQDASSLVNVPGDGASSAPGEPPRKQSATLRANIDSHVEKDGNEVRGYFGVRKEVAYALRLELGFASVDSLGRHYHQAPRPFLRPTLFNNRDRIVQTIVGAASK